MIVFRCFILTAKTDGMDYLERYSLKRNWRNCHMESFLPHFPDFSQPNNFSLGWKNIFFLRRMWKKHLSDGVPTGRKRCEEVRKSPSFSLFGGRKLSKSGWHNERWIPFWVYLFFACLRVVCLILVQEVSKSRGRGDIRAFCKYVRIVFFFVCALLSGICDSEEAEVKIRQNDG